jgi:hypothetical protein
MRYLFIAEDATKVLSLGAYFKLDGASRWRHQYFTSVPREVVGGDLAPGVTDLADDVALNIL